MLLLATLVGAAEIDCGERDFDGVNDGLAEALLERFAPEIIVSATDCAEL